MKYSNYKKAILTMRQRYPLDMKIKMAEMRISKFVEYYGESGVYISFSGGKDSLVVLDIARRLFPNIKAVFCDTWMEYPSLRAYVNTFSNVDRVKPDMLLKDIIDRFGWCFPSKDVSEMIWAARNGKQWAINKLNGLDKNGKPSEYRKQYIKWNKLCWDSDILISPYCCIEQKEKPVRRYERETGRHPILGLLAQESARRTEAWIRTGCNSFDGNRPVSKPISFFTEQDVLRYIWYRGLVVAPPYGEICPCGSCCGQTYLFPADEMDIDHTRLCCTGEKRTGCIFCLVGAHLDRGAKIKRLKQYNKRLYEYCMEELGMEKVLKWILRNY